MRIVILLAAIAPPLLVLSYAIAKTRASWRSEAIWNAFFVGATVAFAAVAFEFLVNYFLAPDRMSPLFGAATSATLVAALPEEGAKFFVLLALAERHVDVRRLQDTIVIAVAVSLGFATLENFGYVASIADWKTMAALRAITSVPAHGIDGLAMGALLVRARLLDNRWPSIMAALAVPVILHAAYDFPLFAVEKNVDKAWFAAIWFLVVALSSVFVIALCNRVLVKAAAADRASGRDDRSTETTDWLMVGGMVSLFAGPMLALAFFHAKGSDAASATWVLSVFPIAFGLDSIFTGLNRKREVDEQQFKLISDMQHEPKIAGNF